MAKLDAKTGPRVFDLCNPVASNDLDLELETRVDFGDLESRPGDPEELRTLLGAAALIQTLYRKANPWRAFAIRNTLGIDLLGQKPSLLILRGRVLNTRLRQ